MINHPPTACRHTVSGSISLSSRSTFQLSLTVLVHYRSSASIQPWRMVPPDSIRISRVPIYLGTQYRLSTFRVRGPHPLCRSFPTTSTMYPTSVIMRPTTPHILLYMVQATPRSLATTCGISFDFFSFGYLDVSVHRVSFIQLCIHYIIYSLKL